MPGAVLATLGATGAGGAIIQAAFAATPLGFVSNLLLGGRQTENGSIGTFAQESEARTGPCSWRKARLGLGDDHAD